MIFDFYILQFELRFQTHLISLRISFLPPASNFAPSSSFSHLTIVAADLQPGPATKEDVKRC